MLQLNSMNLQVWPDSYIQAGVCVQGISTGEGKTHRKSEGQISQRVDE